ncbi:hypothetical protein [Pontivivens ytuae]|uniref:PRC-barrel domain-containing protein n=1 Tax=Pontivivens ytuae TaxID=2789856 RepID=A0A7S9LRK3_9RHOB|nr:hypothetical protein [Pontivivens ytuae]QPH53831.1 hypothetical protein I0K15_18965 [Pontivivens ytuae]
MMKIFATAVSLAALMGAAHAQTTAAPVEGNEPAGVSVVDTPAEAINDTLDGADAELTTQADILAIVTQTELEARMAEGTELQNLENLEIINEFVYTMDGTLVGRIESLQRDAAGDVGLVELGVETQEHPIQFLTDTMMKTDDGIVLAMTDSEFEQIMMLNDAE